MSGEGEGSVSMLDTLISLSREEGTCQMRSELFIKPNNAGIILHYRSAHPKQTKLNTVRSQFLRAARLSSDVDARKNSFGKIRDLFLKNGYPAHVLNCVQRQVVRSAEGREGRWKRWRRAKCKRGRDRSTSHHNCRTDGVLNLRYVDETVLCKVKQVVRKFGLNMNLSWYTPKTLKRELVHSSLSDPPCPSGKKTCNTCKMLKNGRCTEKNVVYELKCKLCGATYVGESKRPLRLRYNEHLRCAQNETKLTPVGDHFETCHRGVTKAEKSTNPPLEIRILMRTRDHPDRKISESLLIRERSKFWMSKFLHGVLFRGRYVNVWGTRVRHIVCDFVWHCYRVPYFI